MTDPTPEQIKIMVLTSVHIDLLETLKQIHDWAALGAEHGNLFSIRVRDKAHLTIEQAEKAVE
ncbi:hypothetical protein LCGC14_1916340 [marine sediment metagenome]|uniref:Uncharacterized protein n=1 Tax=marine sediment metagenome TaxID=412755 RepID=A0A0F9I651_9ZZZZ